MSRGDSNNLISADITLILRKFKLHHENWHERKISKRVHLGVHFEEPVHRPQVKWSMTTAKIYWLILKAFYNGKKVAIIPPLLLDLELASELESDL